MNAKQQNDVRAQVSAEEWQVRVDLAACYRLVALLRLGRPRLHAHLGARAGADPSITSSSTRTGCCSRRSPPRAWSRSTQAARRSSRSPYPGEPGGLRDPQRDPRGAARRAAASCTCTRPPASRSSAQKDGLLPISQQATIALASLGYHDYEGIALHDDEKPRLVRDLGAQHQPHPAQPRPAHRGRRRSPTRSS